MEKFCSPFASPRPWIILPHSFLDIVHRYRYHLHRFHRLGSYPSKSFLRTSSFSIQVFKFSFLISGRGIHDSLSLERTFSSTNLSFRFSNFPLEPRGGVKNTGVLERPCLSSRERRKKNEVEKEEEGRERHTEFPRNPATALT